MSNVVSSTGKNKFYLDPNRHDHRTEQEIENERQVIDSSVIEPCYNDKPLVERDISVEDCIICKCSKKYLEEKIPSCAMIIFGVAAGVTLITASIILFLPLILGISGINGEICSFICPYFIGLVMFSGSITAVARSCIEPSLSSKLISNNNYKLLVTTSLNRLVLRHLVKSEDDNIKKLLAGVKMTDEDIIQLLADSTDTTKQAILDIIKRLLEISKQQLQLSKLKSSAEKLKKKGVTDNNHKLVKANEVITEQENKLNESLEESKEKIQELLDLVVINICDYLVDFSEAKEDKEKIKKIAVQYMNLTEQNDLKQPLKDILTTSLLLELHGSKLDLAYDALEKVFE